MAKKKRADASKTAAEGAVCPMQQAVSPCRAQAGVPGDTAVFKRRVPDSADRRSGERFTAPLIRPLPSLIGDSYRRRPFISLIRDRIILQLQLITPGRLSMTVCRKVSISSPEAATA